MPLITRVRIDNYKSIAHCDVALGLFTVLLGLNTAGKSNFLDALRFVRDALVNGSAEAVSARGGWGTAPAPALPPSRHHHPPSSATESRIWSPESGGNSRSCPSMTKQPSGTP
jgi:hypothetical protein